MFKNSMDKLFSRDKTATPPSWEVNLPDRCATPDQAKQLYNNAQLWVAELRDRTGPAAYPLRTLMNVVNVADLLRDKHPRRAHRLENKLKRLARHPNRLSKNTPRNLGRVVLAINRFYRPRTGTAPAEAVMKQFNQQNLPIQDDTILKRLSGSGSPQLAPEEVQQRAHQAVQTKLDAETIQSLYRQTTDVDE